MHFLGQAGAVCAMNLRSLPQRLSASAVLVAGTAGVVAVLLSVLAMAVGFTRTIAAGARPDRVIVLSAQAQGEADSSLSRAEAAHILAAAGPAADAQLLVQIRVPRRGGGLPVSVALRGVGRPGLGVRPEIHLVSGRMFAPGLHELIVGHAAQAQYQGLEVGSRLHLPGGEWRVTGVFQSQGVSALDSGALGDADTIMAAYRRNTFNSVTALLETPGSLAAFRRALAADSMLHVEAQAEPAYLASQSLGLNTLLSFLAYFVGGMMALGAMFAALNTMHAAVSARAQEIATLRAVGFGAGVVVSSVLLEALLLAILGGAVGALAAFLLFNGHVASMAAGGGGTQLAFAFAVTPGLAAVGIAWAFVIGGVGGLVPALAAARLPVAGALAAAAR
jgi:putative ABC transport system permease protein